MNVLSLFDGMSCGQIALKELGFKIDKYYSSEIDKHAIKQTQLNFPETIQLGDVMGWRSWGIDLSKIDLLFAGSPCQGFSFAGKGLAFDDPRSKLLFVFIDILNHIKELNQEVKFLLENVNMKKRHLSTISEYCGIKPVNINSNLVSAQNRNRWYWSNIRTRKDGLFGELITDIPQPKDRGIFLKDILEEEVDKKYYISKAVMNRMLRKNLSMSKINPDKTGPINTKNNSGSMSLDSGTTFIKLNINGRPKKYQNKSSCFTAGANSGVNHLTGKTNCLTTVQKDNLVMIGDIISRPHGFNKGGIKKYKSPSILSSTGYVDNNPIFDGYALRRLTPKECSRLQTIPEWYIWGCSDTQIYRMLGNGWSIEVIKHILSYLKNK